MELRTLLKTLLTRWKLIVVFVLLGLGAGVALTVTATPQYQSSAQLFVSTNNVEGSNQVNQALTGNSLAADLVQSYVGAIQSDFIAVPVATDLNLSYGPSGLLKRLDVTAPNNRVLMTITYTDTNPRRAADVANAIAKKFQSGVGTLQATPGTLPTDTTSASASPGATPTTTAAPAAAPTGLVKVTVLSTAVANGTPISPNRTTNLVIGIAGGLILGIAIALLRDYFDTRVKDPRVLEDLAAAPLMAVVSFDRSAPDRLIAIREDPHGSRAEAYRQLRSNLQYLDVDSVPRIIAVTSSLAGEGKTSTAINLAASIAEAGNRVCLVEADLRRPTIAKVLGLVSDVGFTTALTGKAEIEDVLQNAGSNLAVLTAGEIPPNPTELLVSRGARSIIDYIADHCDYVVIDAAPLLPVADGMEVASMADATLFVARAGTVRREQVRRSMETLRRVGVTRIGVVLNGLSASRNTSGYNYAYYYTAQDSKDSGRERKHAERARLAAEAVEANAVAEKKDAATPLDETGAHTRELDVFVTPRGTAVDADSDSTQS
ncbi:polysaccharide biosynthesis tyrosine autokinase [Jatrophihabitans sp. YIM 134969]